ncbi:MAG: FHA domain-containing protein [Planctomycetaceae bacterium]
MSTMFSATDTAQSLLITLEVFRPDGVFFRHELKPGHVLIVGSSAACGLRLDGYSVAGMHCSMEADEAGIKIRDWSSDEGTFVDSCRVEEEMYVLPGAEIRIADYRIVVKGVSLKATPKSESVAVTPVSKIVIQAEEDSFQHDDSGRVEVSSEELPEDLRQQVASLLAETEESDSDTTTPEWNRDFDPWDETFESDPFEAVEQHEPAVSAYDRGTFADDTTELLETELEFLRAELAERDARLIALESFPGTDESQLETVESISREEAETLVGRLEQLLVELEEKDTQITTLNDLLRASEDAVKAADEEREQMETWIGEVERRVSQWQGEWHAERDRLQKSIEELTRERDRAEQNLTSGAANGPSNSAREGLLKQLREEYSLLKTKFLEVEQDRNQLQSQLSGSRATDSEQRVATVVDTTLREERLALAQEKAAIARMRNDLTKQQEQFTSQIQRSEKGSDSADLRIRAFREHLREIHETDPRPVHTPTFSDRMAKLWRKLEGRPLDTD